MLIVKTLEEANKLLGLHFKDCLAQSERVPLAAAQGRVLQEDVISKEFVPDFTRSSVDGFAVLASDTFGCSESIPALLNNKGEVAMGETPGFLISAGECAYVPTGGKVPDGADSMVMIEHTEYLKDSVVAVYKPAAPGHNMVFRGDDVKSGDLLYKRGHKLRHKDIGALAALGITRVNVCKPPRVALISTGDELIKPGETPNGAQIRDVNGPMLSACVIAAGAVPVELGIIKDDKAALTAAVEKACEVADMVLISGGSSVGTKDATSEIIGSLGTLLLHGLAVKPGKPTIAGDVRGKPAIGLPGHPVAAFFIFRLLVRPLIMQMLGLDNIERTVRCELCRAIPSNHGREEYIPVRLESGGGMAVPIMGKSGLITTLSNADGYIKIPRNCEGLSAGDTVTVCLWEEL